MAADLAAGPAEVARGAAARSRLVPAARAWLWGTVALTAGAIIIAIALAPPATAPARAALAYLLFAGSSAHVASTAWFYTVPQVRGDIGRHRARYLWIPLALVAGASAIAAAAAAAVLNWLLLPYFGWQFFHYQQAEPGPRLPGRRPRTGSPACGPAERRALLAAGLAGIGRAGWPGPGCSSSRVRPGRASAWPPGRGLPAGRGRLRGRGRGRAGAAWPGARPAQRPPGFCAAYVCALGFTLPAFLFGRPMRRWPG